MGLLYADYSLPAVSASFTFTVSATKTSALVALGAPIPIPTTTGGWFAIPLVKVNSSYNLGSGNPETWTWITSPGLYDASGNLRLSWASTYMRTYQVGDLQTYLGASTGFASGITQMGLSIQGINAGADPFTVVANCEAGSIRVFWQSASGTTPGVEAYKDQSTALPAVVTGGSNGRSINRIRYRIAGSTTAGKFHGLPIGATLKRYS